MNNVKREISKRWVQQVGANASYVMAVLCELQLKADHIWQAREWFFITTADLLQYFPWLKRTTLQDILERLEDKDNRLLLIKRGLKVDGKTLGYSVPDAVMEQWRCRDDKVSFNLADAKRCGGVARALVYEVLCENWAHKIKTNRHAISRQTGIKVSTVSHIIKEIKEIKEKSDAYLQALEDRRLIVDEAGKLEPLWEVGSGYRIQDAQGNVIYTRDLEVAKLALSS